MYSCIGYGNMIVVSHFLFMCLEQDVCVYMYYSY